jgi:hypothetical protein
LWRPLGASDGVGAELVLFKGQPDAHGNFEDSAVYSSFMDYDELKGVFIHELDKELEIGDYTACITVIEGEEQKETVLRSLKLIRDYLVTVETEKQTYSVGEAIEINGRVTMDDGSAPIENAEVTIIVVGEEEWHLDTKTDENGYYNYLFKLPEGFGGSYSLRSEAKVNKALKSSKTGVFYVEGLYLPSAQKASVTAGNTEAMKVTLVNVGTIPLNSISIDMRWNKDSEDIEVLSKTSVPDILEPGESVDLHLEIKAHEEAVAGINTLVLEASCAEGYEYISNTDVQIVEAKPAYYIEITGLKQLMSKGIIEIGKTEEEPKVEGAVRPGEIITQVVSVANTGTGSIRDLQVKSPERLPWITMTTSGTDLILPIGKGLSIRDENARAIIAVNIAPNEFVKPGIYEDVITLKSNAGTKDIPLKVNVGVANIATIILEAVDGNYKPVENAQIRLIGPHTTDWEQPVDEGVYIGEALGNALHRFENIPAGIYTLKVSAPEYDSLEKSFYVPAVIDQIPQKLVIEKKKIDIGWDPGSIMDEVRDGLQNPDNMIIEPKINVDTQKPQLGANFPGDEVTVRDTDLIKGSVGGKLTIKNYTKLGDIYGVEAEIAHLNSDLPADSINLKYGKVTSNFVSLGDFSQGESKDISWSFDLSSLYYRADVKATDTPGQYQVTVPKEVTGENFDAWLKGLAWMYYEGKSVEKVSLDEENNIYIISVPANEDGSYTAPQGNIQRFYGRSYTFDMTIFIRGTGLDKNGEETEVTLDLPVRINYYPLDIVTDPIPESKLEKLRVKEIKYVEDEEEENNEGEEDNEDNEEEDNEEDEDKEDNNIDNKTKEFSEDFLKERWNIDIIAIPEAAGNAAASFGFSQDVAMVDEAFDAGFTFYNPYEDKEIKDISFAVEIIDKPLDANGNVFAGGKLVTERFLIKPEETGTGEAKDGWISIPSIGGNGNQSIKYSIKSRAGMGDISGDYYAYVFYRYTLDEEVFEGYIGPRKFTIEPPPKLYISYKLEQMGESHYKLEAVVTNTGNGKARNVTIGLPSILGAGQMEVVRITSGEGHSQNDLSALNIGDVLAGDTKSGSFEIVVNGLEDWMNVPSLAVHSTKVNDNIVIAPMAIQKVWNADFNDLLSEVDMLEYNIQNLMDKTVYDLAVVIVDLMEYVDEADYAERFSVAIDGISSAISYLGFVKSMFKVFKFNSSGGLKVGIPAKPLPSKIFFTPEEQRVLEQITARLPQLEREITQEEQKLESGDVSEEEIEAVNERIKDLKDEYEYNIDRFNVIMGYPNSASGIIKKQFGISGATSLISWANDVMQYKSNQEEIRIMMEELAGFTYDRIKEGTSRKDVLNMVISEIESKPFRLVDRDKVEDYYLNSSGLDDGQIDAMIQELIDKAEELSISEMKGRVTYELMEARGLLNTYRGGGNSAPSYYPLDPLLEYLKGLNEDLESMWSNGEGRMSSAIGIYKDVWVYHPYYGDLLPYEVKLGEYREPLIESLRIQTRGYSNLSRRWEINEIKSQLAIYDVFNFAFGMMPMSPYIGLINSLFIQSMLMSSLKSKVALDEIDLKYEQRRIFEDMVNNTVGATSMSTTTLSRELAIANSVNRMFVAIDEWRKIDPPLPVEVMSMVVPDVAIESSLEVGQGKAVLKIRNMYTGTLTISPSLEIYDSIGLVAVPEANTVTVAPGQTVTLEIPFQVPRSTMLDAGGYTAVAFLNIAEPETMSIGEPKGPYTAYFFAGTYEQIDARRTYFKTSQPLGRDINPGERDEIFIDSDGETAEIRLFMAARPGVKLELGVYDPDGKFAGNLSGAEKNEVQGIEIGGLINEMDYIRVINPVQGKYRVVVNAPHGDEETQNYSLSVVELPDLGAVPDVSYPYFVVSTTKEIGFEFDVFESSLRYDIEKVDCNVGELRNDDGYTIPSGSFNFFSYDGQTLQKTLEAGKGLSAIATTQLPEDAPDGRYIGLFTVNVEGRNLNPALVTQTISMSVSDSVYGWSDKYTSDIGGLEGYSYNVPIIIELNTSTPEIPVLYSVSQPEKESPYTVNLQGEAPPQSGIMIWIDDVLQGIIETNEEGLFDTSLSLKSGSHKVHVTGFNKYGAQSKASKEYSVLIEGQGIQAPSRPSGLKAVSVDKEGIELKWNPSTGNLKNYRVYRNGQQIGEVTSTTFTDTNIEEGNSYTYVVKVVDVMGKEVGESNQLIVTVYVKESFELIVPQDMEVEAQGLRTPINIGTAIVKNMPGGVITSNAPVDYPLGTTLVIWTARDMNDNSITKEQKITVVDTTPPELTVPEDKSVEATGDKTVVILGEASAYDLVDGIVPVSNNAPDSYSVGTTTVTFTAVDLQGNRASKSVKVTVVKSKPPVVEPPVDPADPPTDRDDPVDRPVVIIPETEEDGELPDENGRVEIDEKGNITVVPKISEGKNTAVSSVTFEDVQDAFKKVESGESEVKKVTIGVGEVEGATSYEQQLPSSIFTKQGESKTIEIKTPFAALEFSLDMFGEKELKGAQNVSMIVSKADVSDLRPEQRVKIGGSPVIQLEVLVDDKPVKWSNNRTSIDVSIDYTPTLDELKKPDRIFMWYIGDNDKLVPIPKAIYDDTTKKVIFSARYSGRYTVAFEDKSFDDLKRYDWAKEQIEMLASRGIINGTSAITYSPEKNITRADAVILIVKALDLEAEFSTNFNDVSTEKYYYEAVGIARSLEIIKGVGDNDFNPETQITRQELMVIVNRALICAGISIKGTVTDLDMFKDVSEISPYAVESISALVKDGIIAGDDKKLISPTRNITRAETAVIIYKSFEKMLQLF